ncbi:hypothetical protein TIFTF001_030245 [Ficus carica]|uniref:Uncharacterized protein n=1 Tax=Ficus carica TaxID=3494 RepID=A0AA88DT07_FICCA|nr:hypothetical protein TIFTF001_030245 [Ficus carica]
MYGARESKRKRDLPIPLAWVRPVRKQGRRWRMGFEEEIVGRSRGRDWRREREGDARERMNGRVAASGDWRREIEGGGRERMEGGWQRLEAR